MNLINSSSINKKHHIALIICLVLTLSCSNTVFAGEKPLNTIGEPALNKIQSETPKTEPETEKKFVPDSEISSPFKATPSTVKPSNTVKITPNAIVPEVSEPKIEDLKTTGSTQQAQSPLADPNNPLGLAQPYNLLDQSLELLKKNEIAKAKSIVEPLSEWLTTLTEYHIQLYKRLNDIDTAKNQAQIEKRLALDSALLRDKAYYQLSLIYLFLK